MSRAFGEKSPAPSVELRTRVKRLLDADRNRDRNPRSNDPEAANFAFFSGPPPGKGFEVWFSAYEAFALQTGLRLLDHDRPQGFAVALLRRLRPELERQHARILKQDPKKLFDQEAIARNARPGDIGFNNIDPVLLVIASSGRKGDTNPLPSAVCRGMEQVGRFLHRNNAESWSMHELVTPAHALANQLEVTPPRLRGRGS